MLIQNRNAHVNASVWPYRSDPNEISFGFEGLVYTDRIGLHWPCKRTGIRLVYMSSFAHVISSVSYGQDRKSQFPLDTQSDLKTNRNVLLSLSANQIRLSPSLSLSPLSLFLSSLAHARTHLHQTPAALIPRSYQLTVELYLPQIENNTHLMHLNMKH